MNITKIFALMLLFLAPLVSASDIDVKLISLEPTTVTAGTFFSVTFEATNTNTVKITDTVFELDVPSTFKIESEDKIEYTELNAGEKVKLTWLVKVTTDANAGFEKINLNVDEDGEDYTYTHPVQIKNFEPTLTIKNVQTTPSQVAPGSDVFVSLSLTNQASFELKNVQIKLDLTKSPFAPKNEVDEQTIKTIIGNTQLKFQLTALPDAEAGVYKIPVLLNYFDEFGNMYTNTNLIAVKIGSTPKLEISQESTILLLNQKQEATIKIVNNGLTKIKLLTVNLQSINAELLSSNNIYLGDIDVDDFQTIDLDIYPKTQNTQLMLILNFKDANNNDFKETATLPLKVYTIEEATRLGLISKNNTLIYLIIIVVLIVGYVIYRKYARKK
ncbi:hypothetical protein COV11_01175 [Candidatus Woesearchaeota archaeon CG10_big_fil_rev_8_21_14_0_10_30_7]|nr:MAG: hypothetical protein COV11_01175 [Candidatus Woesearchaeota archaeon CG10_big_fil_rev_8_21_14_0_10_30_7]